jgi:hypothetical protein
MILFIGCKTDTVKQLFIGSKVTESIDLKSKGSYSVNTRNLEMIN